MSPLPGTAPPIGKKLAAGPAHVDPAWGKRIDAWCGYPWKSPKVTAKLTVALARFVMPELEEPKPVSGNGDGDPYRTPATSTAPEPTTVPSEQDIREKLVGDQAVDVMVAVGPNMFYTVTLPCTLWFLDKGKGRAGSPQPAGAKGFNRAETVLFIDARHIYRQVDRAHREWTPAQIGFLANLVRLYRGEALDFTLGGGEAKAKIQEVFGEAAKVGRGVPTAPPSKGKRLAEDSDPYLRYKDVPGLCRAATLKEIEAQGWSLNPGRYVGVAAGEAVSDEDFKEQLETLNEELETLNAQARDLEHTIATNVAEILEA